MELFTQFLCIPRGNGKNSRERERMTAVGIFCNNQAHIVIIQLIINWYSIAILGAKQKNDQQDAKFIYNSLGLIFKYLGKFDESRARMQTEKKILGWEMLDT